MAMRRLSQRNLFAGLCLLLVCQAGCAAFRPIHGVPARYLPTEMKVGDRSNRRTIDLSLLRQAAPPAHLIDTGDVLGIYIEGIVGKHTEPPPVHYPINNDTPPSFGLPYPVREDGTISLPMVGSVSLRGLTLVQAEEKVKQAYFVPRQLLQPDNYRVQVNLQRPRQYRVLVIRQDSRNEPQPNAFLGQLNIGMVKRGTGKVVNLPAYTNDVLNALTATDGLPGLDAENAVYVIRRRGQFTGGTLDPNWPTDLNPALMMNPALKTDAPVIRGQSRDGEPGYLHSPGGLPGHNPSGRQYPSGIQLTSGSYPAGSFPAGNYDTMPLEPPKVWPDRQGVLPIAFDPAFSGSQTGPTSLEPSANPYTTGTPYTNTPYQGGMPVDPRYVAPDPNGPMWNGAGAGPASGPPQGYDMRYADPRFQPGAAPNSAPPGSGNFVMNGPGLAGPMPYNNGQPGWGPSPTPIDPTFAPGPAGGPPGVMDSSAPMLPGHGIAGNGPLDGRHVVRIPIRLGPGETADIRPEDVILYDGDIVFIESRDTEVFYTGGLLGGGQYTLPRDYDLDILQAIALATSRGNMGGVNRAIGGVSSLNNDVAISPSTAIVLRKLPDGGEVPVKIDLYRARTDLSERIIIQPGDYLLLQYTPLEAVAAFFERHLLETALFAVATQAFNRTSTN